MSTFSIPSATGRLRGARVTRFIAAACAAVMLCHAVDARAATVLPVGSVYTFSTGSTAGNPAGSWTLGDKTWTYVSSLNFSTGTSGPENIQIVDGGLNNHSFNIGSLGTLATSSTSWLGYGLQVTPPSPYVLGTVELDSDHVTNNAYVYKDGFSTLSLFNAGAGTGPGSGDLFNLSSTNGVPTPNVVIPGSLTQIWVRDWIILDGTGAILAVTNNYTQAVPEIDVASFAGALPLLVAGLALLERRRGARSGRTSLAAG